MFLRKRILLIEVIIIILFIGFVSSGEYLPTDHSTERASLQEKSPDSNNSEKTKTKMLQWEITELLNKACSEYELNDYKNALKNFQYVLDNTDGYGAARIAEGGIFMIWKKKNQGENIPEMDDKIVEEAINSLHRFSESKKPLGISIFTEGENAKLHMSYNLAEYYEQKKTPDKVIEQRKIAKSLWETFFKTKDLSNDEVKRELYNPFVGICLHLAEAYISGSDLQNCKSEIDSLEQFLQKSNYKQLKRENYKRPVDILHYSVEVPVRIAKCYQKIGKKEKMKEYEKKAQQALKSFKELNLNDLKRKYLEEEVKKIEESLKDLK